MVMKSAIHQALPMIDYYHAKTKDVYIPCVNCGNRMHSYVLLKYAKGAMVFIDFSICSKAKCCTHVLIFKPALYFNFTQISHKNDFYSQ